MFCSPFRRRRKAQSPEYHLSREEAWQLYLAKLDDEANYFTVSDKYESESEQLCTCQTCIVSIHNNDHIYRMVKESNSNI